MKPAVNRAPATFFVEDFDDDALRPDATLYALRAAGPSVPIDPVETAGDAFLIASPEDDVARLASLTRSVRLSIACCDADSRVEWINPGFERLTGYDIGTVRGRPLVELLACPESDERTLRTVSEAIHAMRPTNARLLGRGQGGRAFWYEVEIQPRLDAYGHRVGTIVLQSDVTDLMEMRARLTRLVESVPAGIVVHDDKGEVVRVNTEALTILGLTKKQAQGLADRPDGWMLVHPDGTPIAFEDMPSTRTLRTGVPERDVLCGIVLGNGQTRWVRVNTELLFLTDGSMRHVAVSFVDVTDAENRRIALERTQTILQDVIETVPDAVVAFDESDRILVFNETYRRLYPAIADMIRPGARFEDVLRAGVATGEIRGIAAQETDDDVLVAEWLAFQRAPDAGELQVSLADGRWIQVRQRRSTTGHSVGLRSDITNAKRTELRIRHLAETDDLTGLVNRRVALARLDAALAEGGAPALALLDLDGFRSVNDTMGHDAGDVFLFAFADRLAFLSDPDWTVARTGGDEFALLLPAVGHEESLMRCLEDLHARLCAPLDVEGRSIVPRVSIGVSLANSGTEGAATLFQEADMALLAVKSAARNGVCRFDKAMRERIATRHALADALRRAIEVDEIAVALQPQFQTDDLRLVGFEALARWNLDGSPVSPGEFVAIAEEYGIARALGRRVLDQSLRTLKRLREAGVPHVPVSVNAETSELSDPSFAREVLATLARHGLGCADLEIEVTENAILDGSSEEIFTNLEALSAAGIAVALDDFGTGYASLAHLRRFPARRLKIDGSFVREIGKDPGAETIVRTVVMLAKGLGMETIAEGVETPAALGFLRRIGCDVVQGFLLGRPQADMGALVSTLGVRTIAADARHEP